MAWRTDSNPVIANAGHSYPRPDSDSFGASNAWITLPMHSVKVPNGGLSVLNRGCRWLLHYPTFGAYIFTFSCYIFTSGAYVDTNPIKKAHISFIFCNFSYIFGSFHHDIVCVLGLEGNAGCIFCDEL